MLFYGRIVRGGLFEEWHLNRDLKEVSKLSGYLGGSFVGGGISVTKVLKEETA